MVSLSINAATNRITNSGFAYDAAGNLVQWPGGTVTMGAEYDVDGRLSVVRWDGVERERYYYDARNLRVKRGFYYQVYGLGGELLGEYQASAGSVAPRLWRERVYFAGRLVATVEEDGASAVTNTDRLGSLKSWSGAKRYPFGEGDSGDNDEFATYRKDTTAQHYYAWHRFYSATWGRFSIPDPYVLSGGLTNPQGWNRYSYVANDPVNYYDPRGLQQDVPTFTVTVYGVAPSFLMYGGGGGGRSEEMEVVWDLPEVREGPDVWQAGGNRGEFLLYVRNPRKDGEDYLKVQDAFVRTMAFLDQDCEAFLSSGGVNVRSYVSDLFAHDLVAVAEFDPSKGAFTGSHGTNLPEGFAAMVFNTTGAFFKRGMRVNNGEIESGTAKAQVFIILHELGHALSAPGFRPDLNDPSASKSNDNLIDSKCKKTLAGVK